MKQRTNRKPPSSSSASILPETRQQSSLLFGKKKRKRLSSSRPEKFRYGQCLAFSFVSAILLFLLVTWGLYILIPNERKRVILDHHVYIPTSIILSSSGKERIRPPLPLEWVPRAPDFGDLTNLMIYQDDGMRRVLHRDIEGERGESRDDEEEPSEKGWFDYVYAFDDDYERSPLQIWEDDKIQDEKTCRRNRWHRRNPMDCNSIHEFDLVDETRTSRNKYLSHGAFRDVFLVGDKRKHDVIVFKQYRFDTEYNHEDFEYMRMDTLITEMFTSSPLYVDIYGACGLSALMEAMPDGDVEELALPFQEERSPISLDDEKDVDPKNIMTVEQKITFAYEMAQALSLMHNYPGGVIVHDDVHLGQFMRTPDLKHVKMQDFNRAEIMLWNEKDLEYCGYLNGPGHGEWRSPEEYADLPLNEKIDVYSLGTNMYAMLTGLLPFYDVEDSKTVKTRIKQCQTSYIDPRYRNRSLAESKLVEAIEKCWECDPKKRLAIEDVVDVLRGGLPGKGSHT